MQNHGESSDVCLEVIGGGGVESVVIGFRKDGELYELAERAPPATATLENSAGGIGVFDRPD